MTPTRIRSGAAAVGTAAALGLGVLTGCGYVDGSAGTTDAAPGAQEGVTVERVLEAAEYVEGRTVTVDAVVTRTLAGTAMTVTDDDSGAGPLLVVHGPEHRPVEGSAVRVTGVVRQSFDRRSAGAELGVEYDEEAFAPFAADPYLIALSVDGTTR